MGFGRVGLIALIAVPLAGCAGDTRFASAPNEGEGTAFGMLTGTAVGSQFGRGSGRVSATVAGAAIGGLIGNKIGAALDEQDRMRAYEAQMHALDNGSAGAPVSWRNDESGRHGTVVPGPIYQRNSRDCRQYTHTVFIEEKPQVARGTACRSLEGAWTAMS
jgi:surface antigen